MLGKCSFHRLKIAIGLGLGALIWEGGNKVIYAISHKTSDLIKQLSFIPDETTYYVNPVFLTGVALASQVLVTTPARHSPVISFTKKALIGNFYYLPTAITLGITGHALKEFKWNEGYLLESIKFIPAAVVGAISGGFAESRLSDPITKVGTKLDCGIMATSILVTSVITSFIGRTSAENVAMNNAEQLPLEVIEVSGEIEEGVNS